MGNPDADHSAYESQQIQTEYELQPQEYEPNQEAAPIPDQYLAATYQNNQQGQQYQAQQMDTVGNDPQTQQHQFQPQQQPPPAQQQPMQYTPPQQPAPAQQQPTQYTPQQQPTQYPPPQPNQAYPPPQPAQYPPQNLQNNTMYQNRPNPNQPAAYPPQPVQYPPKSQPTNQMYSNVSPGVMQPQTVYAPNASPQAFPQPAYLPQQGTGMPLASPHKPGGQPAAVAGIPVAGDGWRSGLFDFMDDPMNALVTAFFPCLTFGQIAEIVDDGHTTCGTSGLLYGAIAFLIGMPCLLSCTYRTKLRNKFELPEAPGPDWVTHFLCEWCALCQEYRELQHRGWDPSIGWQGNLARNQNMQPAPVMMAPMNQRMMA
ncbi:PLAC8 motif-containing protein - like 10 [Theobroma cacao]|nr:PLAC8 motif-containing protein - like 10 [Theobroma cacao]WRX16926.1 PLAC8 motif-containing protein - like 10 [Theobroma cacao]